MGAVRNRSVWIGSELQQHLEMFVFRIRGVLRGVLRLSAFVPLAIRCYSSLRASSMIA